MRKYEKDPVKTEDNSNWNENTLEELNCRLGDGEEHISNLESRLIKCIQSEQWKENLKIKIWGIRSSIPTFISWGARQRSKKEREESKMCLMKL